MTSPELDRIQTREHVKKSRHMRQLLVGLGTLGLGGAFLFVSLPDDKRDQAEGQAADQTAPTLKSAEVCSWHTYPTAEGGLAQIFDLADGTTLEIAGSSKQGHDMYVDAELNHGDKVFRKTRLDGVYSFQLNAGGYVLDATRKGEPTGVCEIVEAQPYSPYVHSP